MAFALHSPMAFFLGWKTYGVSGGREPVAMG